MIAVETLTAKVRRHAKDRPHQVLPESVFLNESIHLREPRLKNQHTELTDQKRN
jgi:hypothetical protein